MNNDISPVGETTVNETQIFRRVSRIIENRKARAAAFANREVSLMYWEIGQYVNSVVLDGGRAAYGKKIVSALATQLTKKYGRTFELRNLRRMMQFAEQFPALEIVSPLATQLAWSHFIEVLPIKNDEAKLYYLQDAAERQLSTKEMRRQISRKAYERQEIANAQLTESSAIPSNVFKDPYLLDVLGLKDNFLEADLEMAILTKLEAFILEFGRGFTFVERQKRMIIDGEDLWLDLLFYQRDLRRLVAVELKLGTFKAQHKGQMELYLKWLDRHERREGENTPIGLILCATASREKIELLELDKAGIAVAEYWTVLPPKNELEQKIKEIMEEAQEFLDRRKTLSHNEVQRQIDYFIDDRDDEED